VRVLFEEVVLDGPDLVEAKFVGETHLFKAAVVDGVLGLGFPWARDRDLIEDAELHGAPPGEDSRGNLAHPKAAAGQGVRVFVAVAPGDGDGPGVTLPGGLVGVTDDVRDAVAVGVTVGVAVGVWVGDG
jgi:hypothetical protein